MKAPSWLLPALSLAIVVLWGILWWPYTVDDSYITYRYAQNAALGLGAVFNEGERLEGYSSPTWMFALALTTWLGLDPVVISKLLGLAAALGLVALFSMALRRSGCDAVVAGFACLWLATTPTLHVYSTSGMETLLFALALTLASLFPAVWDSAAAAVWLIPASLIAVVTLRPEGLLAAVFLSLFWLIAYRRRQAHLAVAVSWLAIAGLLLLRLGYYGSLLPNTFVAKPSPIIRTFVAGHLGFGLFKIFTGVQENLLPAVAELGGTVAVFLALLALIVSRTSRAVNAAALTTAAGAMFVVYARSDWMLGFRFAFPFGASFLFLAALGAGWLRQRLSGPPGRGVMLAAAVAASTWCLWSTVQTAEYLSRHGQGTVNTAMNAEVYVRIGEWLRANSRPGDRLLAYEIGAVGYASRVYLIDQHGLINPDIARIVQWAEGDFREIRIGKDRETMVRIAQYCAEQRPEWFLVRTVRSLPLVEGQPLPPGAAMDALQNLLLEKFGSDMVLAAAFQMRPDSDRWKDDRYLLLRWRERAGS